LTIDEYLALDEGFGLVVEPFGEGSAMVRREEFGPKADIYARTAKALAGYYARMEPPPASKNEATARALFMVRNLGFFSANRSAVEAAVMLGVALKEVCGGAPIEEDVAVFLAQHLIEARQAALRRGFAGASETVQ
jgi:hypothetical protein